MFTPLGDNLVASMIVSITDKEGNNVSNVREHLDNLPVADYAQIEVEVMKIKNGAEDSAKK